MFAKNNAPRSILRASIPGKIDVKSMAGKTIVMRCQRGRSWYGSLVPWALLSESDKLFAAFAHDLVGYGVAHTEVTAVFAEYGSRYDEDARFDGGFGKTITGPRGGGLCPEVKSTLGRREIEGRGQKIDH